MPRLGAPISPDAAKRLARIAARRAKLASQLEALEDERDALIRGELARGVAFRAIGAAAGISHARVQQISSRAPA